MKNKKGFTLIELLVVIAIIGTLSTIITVVFVSAQKNARDQQRKSDLAKIQVALEVYFSRNNFYPPNNTAENNCDSSRGGGAGACSSYSGVGWEITADIYKEIVTQSTILQNLPIDPRNDSTYFYKYEPITNGDTEGACPAGWAANKGCDYYLATKMEKDGSIYCVKGGKSTVTCPASL